MNQATEKPVLVADIGGTHCRFATTPLTAIKPAGISQQRCAAFPDLIAAIDDYLAGQPEVAALALALPGPTHRDDIPLVNNPWQQADAKALRKHYPCPVYLLNDFAAQALSLPLLPAADLDWLQGQPDSIPATRAVIGPGTGLGAAALTVDDHVIPSEAGHMSFAPTTPLQRRLLEAMLDFLPRVYNEAIVSGPGLGNLYRGLQLLKGKQQQLTAGQISEHARQGDPDCREAIGEFSSIFGAVCGDMALAYGAVGGMYLSGGLLTALDTVFDRQAFLKSFADKGAYSNYCRQIPIARIRHPYPGLLGAARFAQQQMQ